jgi:Na+/proline symporter
MDVKISDFLLAGKRLRTKEIVSLLLSSSFGLNAIFYAAWLGYSIGAWALLIQFAWSASFFLLMPAAEHFARITSLHDFLGQQFGYKTKLLAALCSIVGIIYFMAWEVNINVATVAPLLPGQTGVFTISLFAFVAIAYTMLFGLRGNAFVDKYINLIKLIILFAITSIASFHFLNLPSNVIYQSIFPSFDKIVTNLGLIGLITNIVFNLAWQFVDNSSWQSIIGGSEISKSSTSRNLKYSGLMIFLTVNLISTILGISLAQMSNVTPDNILSMASGLIPQRGNLVSTGIIILSIGSMMSLVDGMLLSLALTMSSDVLPESLWKRFSEKKRLRLIQLLVIVFGLITIWGFEGILKAFHINLFDFLYIIVVSQLSLIGPVVFGLYKKVKRNERMWIAILLALIVGFGSVIIGGFTGNKVLIDGAGTFSVITSLLSAWMLSYLS